ncbi:DNA polymerase III subunit chi [Ectothiorhodospira mobilis]|uniref:DNA polymerase III subunit chi n=1 Tax=Ectothiorhodospira mobilis TaxID=195064 RepID=UPI001902CA25|nr:DNA polymerase III subunit chi [Ectothiorhodospira mobilis]MBK1692527.1 DNA polymerase III subunit chi [Ectothiorhodospira mobilis]
MPRVDFYVIPGDDPRQRLLTVCRLVHKAYGLGHRVHVRTASAGESRFLDELLWTFRDDAFIPHGIAPEDPSLPVTLGHDEPLPPSARVLVNLAHPAPELPGDLERVAEVINDDPQVRDPGRERFRAYRERGCEMHHHKL